MVISFPRPLRRAQGPFCDTAPGAPAEKLRGVRAALRHGRLLRTASSSAGWASWSRAPRVGRQRRALPSDRRRRTRCTASRQVPCACPTEVLVGKGPRVNAAVARTVARYWATRDFCGQRRLRGPPAQRRTARRTRSPPPLVDSPQVLESWRGHELGGLVRRRPRRFVTTVGAPPTSISSTPLGVKCLRGRVCEDH